ncbi:MAG: hypothetical protein AAGC55_26455, partial [Myxococcota bacterium]
MRTYLSPVVAALAIAAGGVMVGSGDMATASPASPSAAERPVKSPQIVHYPARTSVRAPIRGPIDWHPSPAQLAAATESLGPPPPGTVVQVGEIVVMQGDDTIVTGSGTGPFSIGLDQLPLIGQRFYQNYPDEFDGLAIFTSFADAANPGAY